MHWLPFDGAMSLPYTYEMFEAILERDQLKMVDVDMFCLSRFAKVNIDKIQEHFDIPKEKIIYVGDRYGYTGTSSPFIALLEGIESGKIKRRARVRYYVIQI